MNESIKNAQSMVADKAGSLYPANRTLADWFNGCDLPELVPIGTLTEYDSDEEATNIVRQCAKTEDTEEAHELSLDGVFVGAVRKDSEGWIFIEPDLMAEGR